MVIAPDPALARRLFDRMHEAAGPRHWWPADRRSANGGRDEIIIGAVLTQNTAWQNVEKALNRLRRAGLLSLCRLARLDPTEIAPLIRPAGYFNLKARRLGAVARFFAPRGRVRYRTLAKWTDEDLRQALLGVYGVGPETADSILLYALGRPCFVIDAYTLRIGRRHGIFDPTTGYEQARAWFTGACPEDPDVYNEYHALLVWVGNRRCKPVPRCHRCPLYRRDCFASKTAWQTLAAERGADPRKGEAKHGRHGEA